MTGLWLSGEGSCGGVGTSQQPWGQEVGKLDARRDLSPCALEGICVTHLLEAASTCLQLRFDLRGVEGEKLSIKYEISS